MAKAAAVTALPVLATACLGGASAESGAPPGTRAAAACRALERLVRTENRGSGVMCLCRMTLLPTGRAVGVLRGRHISIDLSDCGLCDPPRARAALAALAPA